MKKDDFSLNADFDLNTQDLNNKGDSLEDIFDHLEDDVDSHYENYENTISSALGENSSVYLNNGEDSDDYFDSFDYNENSAVSEYNQTLIDIDAILIKAIESRASDVHINPDGYVAFTVLGEIMYVKEFGIIPASNLSRTYGEITTHVAQSTFADNLELDTSYTLKKKGKYQGRRFRLSVGRSFDSVFMVFRVISDEIPTLEDLKIPKAIRDWTKLPNGLVLICGPTGTGKSTTFASLINDINKTKPKKIITVEKPVEYVYPQTGLGLVTQREVGRDTRKFASALTSAMRQNPDIIMIGEVRDKEEVDSLLQAAESGHLSFSTMHTNSPPSTINRIKSLYDGDEQRRVLSSLQENIRGIANQVLVKTKNGNDRFALQSILHITPEVSEMIGRGDVSAIQQYMERKGETIEHKLAQAVLEGRTTLEYAREHCIYPDKFTRILKEKIEQAKKKK